MVVHVLTIPANVAGCHVEVVLPLRSKITFSSEQATKVMIELLGTYTEDNASQARDDAQRSVF